MYKIEDRNYKQSRQLTDGKISWEVYNTSHLVGFSIFIDFIFYLF